MSQTDRSLLTRALAGYRRGRLQAFRYRHEADLLEQVLLAVGFAALTGIAAQVRIPLPFTPVPITLQTFAVLLTGVALGGRLGGASQTIYAGAGAAGIPWFAGASAGLGTILGPTGGYIIGFVLAATVVGGIVDRYPVARRLPVLSGLLLIVNFVVIYGAGLPWLYGWLTLVKGTSPTLVELLTAGLFPFIPGDLVKVAGVVAVATAITPLDRYGPERAGPDG